MSRQIFLSVYVRIASVVMGSAFALGYLNFRMQTDLSASNLAIINALRSSVANRGYAVVMLLSMLILAVGRFMINKHPEYAFSPGGIIGGFERPVFWFIPFICISEIFIWLS